MMTECAGGSSAGPLGPEEWFCGGPDGAGEGGREGRLGVGGGAQSCPAGVDERRAGATDGDRSRSRDSEEPVSSWSWSGVEFQRCSTATEVRWVPLGNLGSDISVATARGGGPALAFPTGVGGTKAERPSSVEGGVG